MPLKITKKSESSKKHKTLLEIGNTGPDKGGNGKHVASLIIDRLSVTITIKSTDEAYGYLGPHIAFLKSAGAKPAKRSKGYKSACRIVIPSIEDPTKWPFYEFRWNAKGVTAVRLDFIPADLGAAGMEHLNTVLWEQLAFYGGWAYFFQRGRVTRIDLAADFPNLRMEDIYLFPSQGVTSKQYYRNGKLESVRLGKPTGNHTLIYDRKAKRVAKKKDWKGKVGLRVERRLLNPNIMLKEIESLDCPFQELAAVSRHIEKPDFEKKAYIWDFVMDACEVRGLSAALARLPQDKRTAYRKYLKSAKASLWELDTVWLQWAKVSSMLEPVNIEGYDAWN